MVKRWFFEEWIWENLSPVETNSASLLFERMESQSNYKLPGIYEPLQVEKKGHWYDVAICAVFAAAMDGAQKVLDIGPGDGWPILRVAHSFQQGVGIDLSPKRVAVQQENARRLGVEKVEFRVMDSMNLDFPSRSFDGVMAASSVEQSRDPYKTLQEIARVLKGGGRLAIYFEDLEVYFPKEKGDERVWAHLDGEEPIFFYVCREKEPPREAVYALFLKTPELHEKEGLKEELLKLGEGPWHSFAGEAFSPYLSQLRSIISQCQYYTLSHLSPSQLEKDLLELGFVDLVTVDPFLADVMDFFQLAQQKGYLQSFQGSFTKICELLGTLKVMTAEAGCGAFTVARKGDV